MCNRAGFTLLELIIVMFLITLILAISTVFFAATLPSSRFNSTARDMASTIRHARTLSKLKGEEQVVFIDLDAHKYGIENLRSKDLSPDIDIRVDDPLAGEIIRGRYRLIFHP
ncbi:MAG: prepilin-type N-terminal cleavage/methylation domain-containing protein, partial [Nitrospirae bacterium]|nr:prepilin-type N-terminal cleavage/methylation domain-containing protein [Nitrospirota bacterium]